ncbi:hypothetical protein [Superficieibacter electus]|nr:hypothetical protein [Superficieibacter electus]
MNKRKVSVKRLESVNRMSFALQIGKNTEKYPFFAVSPLTPGTVNRIIY